MDFSTDYLSAIQSNAREGASASKVDKLRSSTDSLQGATYEELEDTMKTFESYLLEQTIKEVRESMKELSGEDDEDPFMSQQTDMYMDQTISTLSEQMVSTYGKQLTQDLTNQVARNYGVEIPDDKQ